MGQHSRNIFAQYTEAGMGAIAYQQLATAIQGHLHSLHFSDLKSIELFGQQHQSYKTVFEYAEAVQQLSLYAFPELPMGARN